MAGKRNPYASTRLVSSAPCVHIEKDRGNAAIILKPIKDARK